MPIFKIRRGLTGKHPLVLKISWWSVNLPQDIAVWGCEESQLEQSRRVSGKVKTWGYCFALAEGAGRRRGRRHVVMYERDVEARSIL